ncbi:MAG: hypothetical protein PHV55_09415 [Candidatus Omnitrophica bacterium]|nr:hypothetical protein [Candidatus Omnitrophota bacterium]
MKKDIYINPILIMVTGCILILAGCTTITTRRSTESGEIVHVEKPLSVAAALRFEDIPIPSGFSGLRDQSFIFQDGSTRVGLVRYAGRAGSSQVINFFKTQMALYNWDLLNVVEYENTTLNFIKSSESCVITIEPLTTKTIISVVIAPKTGTINTGFGSKKDRY